MSDIPGPKSIDRLVDHFRDTPGREVRIVQLGPGDQATSSLHVLDPDIVRVRAYSNPRASSEILLDSDRVA